MAILISDNVYFRTKNKIIKDEVTLYKDKRVNTSENIAILMWINQIIKLHILWSKTDRIEQTDEFIIIVRDFNIPLSTADRMIRHIFSKDK